uniref:Uncharacterized protein n=1 Tax=Arundo donax TaxID=35708 RepID=A0A0A9MZZ4_ARUDO
MSAVQVQYHQEQPWARRGLGVTRQNTAQGFLICPSWVPQQYHVLSCDSRWCNYEVQVRCAHRWSPKLVLLICFLSISCSDCTSSFPMVRLHCGFSHLRRDGLGNADICKMFVKLEVSALVTCVQRPPVLLM